MVKSGSWINNGNSNDGSFCVILDTKDAISENNFAYDSKFYIDVTIEDFKKVANNGNEVHVDIWNVVALTNVVVLVPKQDSFVGTEPTGTEKILTVNRSDYSVDISEDLKTANISPKYARFYLADANDNPIDPTKKLTVQYGTPCAAVEKGFYITTDTYLTQEMFYNWNGYGVDATYTSRANVEFHLGEAVNAGGDLWYKYDGLFNICRLDGLLQNSVYWHSWHFLACIDESSGK